MNTFKLMIACWWLFAMVGTNYAAQVDWHKDWEQTLAAAKKEGQVNIYIYRYEGLLQDFKRDFPASTLLQFPAAATS